MKNNLIAIDADGVLVDYNQGYAKAWHKAFGLMPEEVNPNAYWAMDRFSVNRLDSKGRARLREAMDESHWSSLGALPGAVEACIRLKGAGYRLVCVTALKSAYRDARILNLQRLGFPLEDVYTTGGDVIEGISPKASAIGLLNPVVFVDDFAPYFRGISSPSTHLALVTRELDGSPNVGEALTMAHSAHKNLISFASWWIDRP